MRCEYVADLKTTGFQGILLAIGRNLQQTSVHWSEVRHMLYKKRQLATCH